MIRKTKNNGLIGKTITGKEYVKGYLNGGEIITGKVLDKVMAADENNTNSVVDMYLVEDQRGRIKMITPYHLHKVIKEKTQTPG